MIRFILCASFLLLFLLLGFPVQILLLTIGIVSPSARDQLSTRIVNWAASCVCVMAGIKAEFIGLENIPEDRPVLFVGNHRSYFDILITLSVTKKRTTGYVAKREMLGAPLLSLWMELIHCKFLDRKDMKQGMQVILSAIEDIKNGVSIFIFPEGTRNKGEEGSLLPFHEGSLKIAAKSGCPVIPVAISNSYAVFERQFPRIKSSRVVIEYCKGFIPSNLDEKDRKAPGAYTRRIIAEALERHKGRF